VIQFLRLIGIFNGAVWLGSAVFFTLSIGPAVFSPQMLANFGGAEHPLARLYAGLVAQVLISSYFKAGLWCAAIAVLHLVAEWLYTGRTPRAWRVYLLLFLLAGGLAGKLYLQPNMEALHRAKYSQSATPEGREAAAGSFKTWHAVSQSLNLLMLLGMAVHLWGVAVSGEASRFVPTKHFRS
jgi:hypothetical protein